MKDIWSGWMEREDKFIVTSLWLKIIIYLKQRLRSSFIGSFTPNGIGESELSLHTRKLYSIGIQELS